MSLNNLYQQMILEHNKNPRNFKQVAAYTHYSHGHNPLCGDDFVVMVRLTDDNIIEDIGFTGQGCAISKASGSLMTQALKGKRLTDALLVKDNFLSLITQDDYKGIDLGKLKVFEGVKKYPVRVKCAALVWRALEDALNKTSDQHLVSTE